MLEQAAAVAGFELEIGALRFGLMRVLSEETDPTRLALALARLSNAGVRARLANAGVEADRAADREAEWLDRVSEAMLGYTLQGDDFARSPVAQRAGIHQIRTKARWEEAHRIVQERHAAADAAEAERRRRVEELAERMGWDVPVWGDEPGKAPLNRLARDLGESPLPKSALPIPVSPASYGEPPPEPDRIWDGGERHEPTDCLDDASEPPWHADEEDAHDRAVLARIAEAREAAARRSEADREFSAYAIAGLNRPREPDPSPRLARGGRARESRLP